MNKDDEFSDFRAFPQRANISLHEKKHLMKEPQVGDTLHYVHNPGSGQPPTCTAAIVIGLADAARGFITVREFADMQLRRTRYSPDGEFFTWHWKSECPKHKRTKGEPV